VTAKRSRKTSGRVARAGMAQPELRSTIHAVVRQSPDRRSKHYTAECLEVAVVTQARSLQELMSNLQEAIRLHLDDDASALGIAPSPRVSVIYEMTLPPS